MKQSLLCLFSHCFDSKVFEHSWHWCVIWDCSNVTSSTCSVLKRRGQEFLTWFPNALLFTKSLRHNSHFHSLREHFCSWAFRCFKLVKYSAHLSAEHLWGASLAWLGALALAQAFKWSLSLALAFSCTLVAWFEKIFPQYSHSVSGTWCHLTWFLKVPELLKVFSQLLHSWSLSQSWLFFLWVLSALLNCKKIEIALSRCYLNTSI